MSQGKSGSDQELEEQEETIHLDLCKEEEEPDDQHQPNGRRWRHRLKLPSLLWLCKKRRQGYPDATGLRQSYLDAVDRDRFVAVVE